MKKAEAQIEPEASNVEDKSLQSRQAVREQVFEVVEELCLTSIEDGTQTLLEDLSLDSLRMVMLLVSLEDRFEIELDESDMNPFALITVNDVVDLVLKYVPLKKGGG